MYIIYIYLHIYSYTYLCIFLYIYGCLSIKGQKQEFLAIFAFAFIHRYTGTNKPRSQNVPFDLVTYL